MAVSTAGASPALAQRLRDHAGALLTDDVVALAGELAARRADVRAAGGSTEEVDWGPALDAVLPPITTAVAGHDYIPCGRVRRAPRGFIVKTKAAILWEINTPWSVEEVELDPPGPGEVLVKMAASGMCHSDEHLVTGDLPFALPIIGGHEGAGVIEEVGEGVSWLAPGDHVVFGFIPSCGRCPSCSTGHQNLCDLGALMGGGMQIADGTSRHHAQGKDLGLMCLIGTFSHHTVVNEASCIKLDDDVPLDRACLLGCGVVTGWGSSVYAAEVTPGDIVAVVGVGGIGANAIQGARLAGAKQIWAIDPLENKREKAMEFGATHTAASLEDALPAITEASWGRMANKVIMTMGVGSGELLAAPWRSPPSGVASS